MLLFYGCNSRTPTCSRENKSRESMAHLRVLSKGKAIEVYSSVSLDVKLRQLESVIFD